MITAKCSKCGGSAIGSTFENASSKINHAVGLSRGIKCGDNYNMVCQVEDSTPKPAPKPATQPAPKPATQPDPKTPEELLSKKQKTKKKQ